MFELLMRRAFLIAVLSLSACGPARGLGTLCELSEQCAPPLSCRAVTACAAGGLSSGRSACTSACSSDADCAPFAHSGFEAKCFAVSCGTSLQCTLFSADGGGVPGSP